MKKRVLLVVLIFILVFSLIPAALAEGSDTPSPTEQPTVSEEPVVSPEPTEEPAPTEDPDAMPPLTAAGVPMGKTFGKLDISKLGSWKEGLSDSQKKLSTALLQLTDSKYLSSALTQSELVNQMKAMKQIKESAAMPAEGNDISGLDVYVYIRIKEGCSLDIVEPYVSKIENKDETIGLCAAWVNAGSIDALASLDGVASIREVTPPIVYAGSEMSEGDTMLNTDDVRNILDVNRTGVVDGTGIKVGVISDGVDSWSQAKASGDLPADFDIDNVLSNTVHGDEGTAMLEIVHDLAPGAELYFHDCGNNTMAFNSAIDDLVAAGCTVICDDIGWIGEPFFEDGDVASHVASVLAANPGLIYTSSAGNAAYEHYQGKFDRWGSSWWHDFSGGAHPKDSSLYVRVAPGKSVTAILQWNDPFGASSNDYDLYFFDPYGNYIRSNDTQDGVGCDPLEGIGITNTGSSNLYLSIEVFNYDAPVNKTLEIYIYGNSQVYTNNIVTKDSIFGHPAVPGVIACGAIDGNKSDTTTNHGSAYGKLEWFSSRGPVTMLGGVVRKKPDICAIDGVSVTGVGGFGSPFYGTSAASPHMAAVAALLMDRFDSDKTAAQIRQIILDNRVDLGAVGYDYSYGWGKSDALAAAKSYNYVTFDSQDGDTTPARQLVARKAKVTVPTAPTNGNFNLEGWYTNTDFAASHKWNFSTSTVTTDITLYANWVHTIKATPNNTSYGTVTGGGNYREGVPVTLKATPKPGYRFINWMEGATVVTTNADYPFTPDSDHTFVAQFAKIGTPAISAISSPAYNKVDLSWSAVDGATGYWVYRATSKYGTYRNVQTVSGATTCTNTVSTWGITYYYKVRAYCKTTTTTIPDITTYGSQSGYKYITPNWEKPTLTAARLNYHSIQLTWNDVRDADSYTVYRSTSSSGTYKLLSEGVMKLAGATGLTYVDEMTASMIGKTYYYKVRPVDENGGPPVYGPCSSYKYAKASWQKLNLTAVPYSYHSNRLSWNAVEDADYYIVYRSPRYYGTYTELPGGGEVRDLFYVDDGLTKGVTYYYKVRPIDEAIPDPVGTGPQSGYKYAKVDWPKINLTAKTKNYYSVALSWNALALADKYEIERSTSYKSGYELIDTLTGVATGTVSYVDDDPDLDINRTYYYRIRPYEGTAAGPYCSYKSAKPAWPKITLKAASNGYNSIKLTWNEILASEGENDYYDVFRCESPSTDYLGKYAYIGFIRRSVGPTVTFTDDGSSGGPLVTGKTYYYSIVPNMYIGTTDDVEHGPFCSYAYAKPVPATPANLHVVKATSTSMTVTWDAVAGETIKYQVYRATSKYGTYTRIATTDLTSASSTRLSKGRTYYYKVRAYMVVGSTPVYGSFTAPVYLKLV